MESPERSLVQQIGIPSVKFPIQGAPFTLERVNNLIKRSSKANSYWQVTNPNKTLKLAGATVYVNRNYPNTQGYDRFVYWPDYRVAGTIRDIVTNFRNAGINNVTVGSLYTSTGQLGCNQGIVPLSEEVVATCSYDPLNPAHQGIFRQLLTKEQTIGKQQSEIYRSNMEAQIPKPTIQPITPITTIQQQTGTITISPPPEFMLKAFSCEGYWDQPFQGGYQPIISTLQWPDKEKFLRAVYAIEEYLRRRGTFKQTPGFSPSRIVEGQFIGSGRYDDYQYPICWPENYVQHYIYDHNVMPTEIFFNYVVERINTVPNEYLVKWGLV